MTKGTAHAERRSTQSSSPARLRRLRFRLVTVLVGGAFVVSMALALVSYGLARGYLLGQRRYSAIRQAQVNARLVGASLQSSADLPRLLASLPSPGRSSALVNHEGAWFAASLEVGRDTLPPALLDLVVVERERGRQLFFQGRTPRLAVGLPFSGGGAYFEVFSLVELDSTLRTLRLSLLAAVTATMIGAASLARWASRRLLDPLAEIGATASAIADGRLDARLDVGEDEELSALADGFNRMVDSLQERIERDARFASNVSHELRSPLTALKSAVQALQTRRPHLDDRTAHVLDLLAGEVGRFERLVRDLLEISRFDAGASRASFEDVNLGELVLQVVENRGAPAVPVEVASDAVELVVLADKRRLEQVVSNLIDNAESHGEGVEVVRVEAPAEHARIVVEDRGPGVSAQDRVRIFERFYRGPRAGRERPTGAGLGLALVTEHVRLHGGRVWVEDGTHGARFVVELPRAAP